MTIKLFSSQKNFTAAKEQTARLDEGDYTIEIKKHELRENQKDGTTFLSIDAVVVTSAGVSATSAGTAVRQNFDLPDNPNTEKGQIAAEKIKKFLSVVAGGGKTAEELDAVLEKLTKEPELLEGQQIKVKIENRVAKKSGNTYKQATFSRV